MKRGLFILPLLFLSAVFLMPLASASLAGSMAIIENHINDYKAGTISAAKLIVFIEYEKVFPTDDFDIVFTAHPFYRYDVEYYEKREDEAETYYNIGYYLRAKKGADDTAAIKSQIISFLSDLNSLIDNPTDEQFKETQHKLGKIKSAISEADNCEEIMESVGLKVESEEDYFGETRYTKLIDEQTEQNCWNEPKCEWYCEPTEDCWEKCFDKEICDEDCISPCVDEEICEEVCEDVTVDNVTTQNCTTECRNETMCAPIACECHWEYVCEEVCKESHQNCYNKCEDHERCDDWVNGEIRLEGWCREKGNDLSLHAWGPGWDQFQRLNDIWEWNCDSEIDGQVKLRKAFQTGVNNEFAKWYFEEYMSGNDYDRIINGGNGFKRVLEILKTNEEDIANNMHCSESKTWPDGFTKIDVMYINNNTHVEIWEKMIPVAWEHRTKYYTTLYKYSWIPDKELLKGLINYKLEEMNTMGPTSKDIADIKADQGQMEIIEMLSESYGGSFDVKLELKDETGSAVLKYLQINPDVAMRITDSIEDKPDISIIIDYDVLYDFISYMSYRMDGDVIRGPHWVGVVGEGGPGKFFSAIGAISRMWRKGVTIKPRYALIKMFFNIGDFITLMGEAQADRSYQTTEIAEAEPTSIKIEEFKE